MVDDKVTGQTVSQFVKVGWQRNEGKVKGRYALKYVMECIFK